MTRTLGIVLCGAAVAVMGSLSTRAGEPRSEIKGGIEGKVSKVDVEKGALTISREDGRERTFSVTNDTTIVGPRGGVVHRRLHDPRFHKGLPITVVADGEVATELHLGFDRKARGSAAVGAPSAAGTSTSGSSTTDTPDTPAPAPRTRRSSGFRGIPGSRQPQTDTAKSDEGDAEDNDFPGKVKSADASRHLLVITLLNGKDRSFMLARDVKITHNGRAVRQGLADAIIKPGVPVTVITEEGGRKVKEVKVTPATTRRLRSAG
jgi:hypothetical protein